MLVGRRGPRGSCAFGAYNRAFPGAKQGADRRVEAPGQGPRCRLTPGLRERANPGRPPGLRTFCLRAEDNPCLGCAAMRASPRFKLMFLALSLGAAPAACAVSSPEPSQDGTSDLAAPSADVAARCRRSPPPADRTRKVV